MTKVLLVVLCLLCLCIPNSYGQTDSVIHITFLSGNRIEKNNDFWSTQIKPILAEQQNVSVPHSLPHTDLLMWLGNVAEADTNYSLNVVEKSRKAFSGMDFDSHYQNFVNDVVRSGGGVVDGVWDIQDVGGAKISEENLEIRSQMKEIFVNFLGKEVSLRTDILGHTGMYHFLTLKSPSSSPLSQLFDNSVCVIALDILSFRSPLPNLHDTVLRWKSREPPKYARYRKDTHDAKSIYDDDLLGAQQWEWLEDILTKYVSDRDKGSDGRQKCAVVIIATAWQVLLNDNKPLYGWDLYPASRSRLLDLLQKTRSSRFVFLSGHASAGELGVIRRAARENVMPQGMLRLYADKIPIVPATKRTADLLPSEKPLVEATSGVTHFATDSKFLGFLYRWAVKPVINEAEKPMSFYPRYISLERSVLSCRSFGTLRILQNNALQKNENDQQKILQSFSLEIALYSLDAPNADNKCEDVSNTITLDQLPSFGSEFSQRQDPNIVPLFSVYNVPKEYPALKKLLLSGNCPEFECSQKVLYMLSSMISFRHSFLISVCVCIPLVLLLIIIRFSALKSKHRNIGTKKKQ